MRQVSCPQEVAVLKAVRTGRWEESLSTHTARCAECKEIVEASKWMQNLAQSSEKTHALPDASLLWWRAQLSEEQARVERAHELLEWVEIISATVISAGLAVWIGWNWYTIQAILTSFLADSWSQLWITASSAVSTTPIVLSLGVVILSSVAVVLAYPIQARD